MTRTFALLLLLISLPGFALGRDVLPSELKGWSWYQSTILGGISQPSRDQGQDFPLSAPGTSRSFAARIWKSARARGLVLLIPGTGGNAQSGLANLTAENFQRLGYDTVIVTNPFTPEFQSSFSRDGLIGLPQRDFADAHRMLEAALHFYFGKFGKPKQLVLAGISLGAIYAGLEARGGGAAFDRILLLNPPASVAGGIAQLDDMIRISIAESDVLPFNFQVIWAFLQAQHGMTPENIRGIRMFLPEQEREGRRLIGDTFRQSLRAVARGMLQLNDSVLSPEIRRGLEQGLEGLTFERFIGFSAAALAERREVTIPVERILSRVTLLSILTGAEGLSRVRVVTNADDFLVTAEDRTQLERLLGDHLSVFNSGSHCGNYWTPSFQKQLAELLP